MQFSANIFQNDLPSRIKFKKKSSLFGESCDLGGPGPPPPETFRGVGGVEILKSPLTDAVLNI